MMRRKLLGWFKMDKNEELRKLLDKEEVMKELTETEIQLAKKLVSG